jgi:hypothetical protein
MKSISVLNNQRGVATFIAIVMVLMLTLVGLAALSTSDDEVTIAGNQMHETRAFYAAQAGLERACAALQTQYDSTGLPPSGPFPVVTTAAINGYQVTDSIDDGGAAEQRVLTSGTMAGLNALVKSYTMTSEGVNPKDESRVTLSQFYEFALVPLFQFAVFYGNDLEIAPGPEMTLIGRVHSNGNLYVQSNVTLRMDSYVTASGDLIHGRKGPEAVGSGDVIIKNASGDLVSMKQGGEWIDSRHEDWYDSSTSLWQGRVQDAAHGQPELNLPLSPSAADDPHKMIERAEDNPDSYENRSTNLLKFVDQHAYRRASAELPWVDVTDSMVDLGVIQFRNNAFTDQREGDLVDVMELDVDKMYDEGFVDSDEGTVIYYSDETTDFPALRVKNASTLGGGLTIASENPVYTLGDYNSVQKKPSSILADAVTFLSSNWDDAKSALDKSKRTAKATTVNVSYVTGNVETTESHYNGGFENLPRFLEVWSGKKFTWSGSAVNLWNSRQADGNWSGTYYSPPDRVWKYDTALDNIDSLPPETPVFRVFQRTGWQQHHVGYEEEDWYANGSLE